MTELLIICPLVFLAGFIDAIAGGGGLISLPAYLFAGLPVHNAIATNKLSSAMGTTISTIKYGKNGFINFRRGIPCIIFALIGSGIGANLALIIPENIFIIIMLVILPFIAFYVLKTKNFDTSRLSFSDSITLILCLIPAFFVGMYDGFYGPGTGTFLLLLLTGMARVSLNEAAGTTKVINLTSNITSLIVYIINGKVIFYLGLIAGIFSIAGNYMGAKFFTQKGAKILRPIIILVLCIFFCKILLENFIFT